MAYDINFSFVLEEAFQNKKHRIDLRQTQLMMPYKINLHKMQQTRVETGKKRAIQRVQLALPVQYVSDTTGGPVTPCVQALIGASKGLRPSSSSSSTGTPAAAAVGGAAAAGTSSSCKISN